MPRYYGIRLAAIVVVALSLGACGQVDDPLGAHEDELDPDAYSIDAEATVPLEIFSLHDEASVEAFILAFPDLESRIRAQAQSAANDLHPQAIPFCNLTAAVSTSWTTGNKYGRGRVSCSELFLEADLGVEIFDHANGIGASAGKVCGWTKACSKNTSGIPNVPNGDYCAYADVVVFGTYWGGAAGTDTCSGGSGGR